MSQPSKKQFRLVTSYFAKITQLTKDGYGLLGIVQYPPLFYTGWNNEKLAPSPDLLQRYKSGYVSSSEYVIEYEEVLAELDPRSTYRQCLNHLGENGKVALLCFEKAGDFCHRRLVAKWFEKKLGIEVPEYDFEPVKTKGLFK